VWRHDGASISESALVLGGLVISAKGKSARWKIWPRREKRRRSHMWSEFFVQYAVCSGKNHVYTQVTGVTNHVYM
jgi:hypothetical protein